MNPEDVLCLNETLSAARYILSENQINMASSEFKLNSYFENCFSDFIFTNLIWLL